MILAVACVYMPQRHQRSNRRSYQARRLERLPDFFVALRPLVFFALPVLRAAVLLLAFFPADFRLVDLEPGLFRLDLAFEGFLVARPPLCICCFRCDICWPSEFRSSELSSAFGNISFSSSST
jgi:hypothetical protein